MCIRGRAVVVIDTALPSTSPASGPSRQLLFGFCVVVKLIIYLLSAGRYGYLSDELYFLDAADHLAPGYIDFPPLIVWITAAVSTLLGESVMALRLIPMLAGIGVTLLTVEICRLAGGRIFAQWLAALASLFAPGLVSVQCMLTMNALDQLWWLAGFCLLLAYAGDARPRLMIALGLVLGFGILTKLSILALCVAIPVSLLVWERGALLRREFWLAVCIALLVASPFLAWQVSQGFPFLEFIQAYNSDPPEAMVLQNPALGLLLTMNPSYALLWLPGAALAILSANRDVRIVGTAAWLCLVLFLLTGVKFYFAVPIFALFIAVGAVFWERVHWPFAAPGFRAGLLLLIISGAAALPAAAPLLPRDRLSQLATFLRDSEQGFRSDAPVSLGRYFPHFAEMHGWPELVSATTRAFETLTDAQRESAVLVAAYYGQAAALNQLDHDNRLPEAHSGHMNYHLWNSTLAFDHGIFVGYDRDELAGMFAVVEERGQLHCDLCMTRERELRIFFVEQPRMSAEEIRASIKRFYFF